MADPVTTSMVVFSASNIGSGVLKTLSDARAEDAARQEAEYNAKQLDYAADMALAERSTTINQQLARGRADIASGQEAMSSAGNVGSSAQSQVFGSVLNLEKDLAAISYKYTNEAIQKKNAAAVQRYNAEIHKRGRTNALIGGLLNIGSTVAGSGLLAAKAGYIGGLPADKAAANTFAGATTKGGMYGAWTDYTGGMTADKMYGARA